jgi:hypothetical protein
LKNNEKYDLAELLGVLYLSGQQDEKRLSEKLRKWSGEEK